MGMTDVAIRADITGGAILATTTLVNRDTQLLFAVPAMQYVLLLKRCSIAILANTEVADRVLRLLSRG